MGRIDDAHFHEVRIFYWPASDGPGVFGRSVGVLRWRGLRRGGVVDGAAGFGTQFPALLAAIRCAEFGSAAPASVLPETDEQQDDELDAGGLPDLEVIRFTTGATHMIQG